MRILGNMKRAKPNSHSKCVTASDTNPTAKEEPTKTPVKSPKKPRRSVASRAAGVGGAAYAGFSGIGGAWTLALPGLAAPAEEALVEEAPAALVAADALPLATGLGAAIRYFLAHDQEALAAHEADVLAYFTGDYAPTANQPEAQAAEQSGNGAEAAASDAT